MHFYVAIVIIALQQHQVTTFDIIIIIIITCHFTQFLSKNSSNAVAPVTHATQVTQHVRLDKQGGLESGGGEEHAQWLVEQHLHPNGSFAGNMPANQKFAFQWLLMLALRPLEGNNTRMLVPK